MNKPFVYELGVSFIRGSPSWESPTFVDWGFWIQVQHSNVMVDLWPIFNSLVVKSQNFPLFSNDFPWKTQPSTPTSAPPWLSRWWFVWASALWCQTPRRGIPLATALRRSGIVQNSKKKHSNADLLFARHWGQKMLHSLPLCYWNLESIAPYNTLHSSVVLGCKSYVRAMSYCESKCGLAVSLHSVPWIMLTPRHFFTAAHFHDVRRTTYPAWLISPRDLREQMRPARSTSVGPVISRHPWYIPMV